MTITREPNGIPVTTRAAAQSLGITERAVRMLRDAHLLTLDAAAVQAAVDQLRQPAPPLPAGQPVLRVPAHRPESPDSWDGNRALGYSPHLSDHDQLEALRQWWRCDPDTIIRAGTILVTVAEIAVALLSVTAAEPSIGERQDKRHQFTAELVARLDRLGTPARHLNPAHLPAASMLGHRYPTRSGGPIAYASSSSASGDRHS